MQRRALVGALCITLFVSWALPVCAQQAPTPAKPPVPAAPEVPAVPEEGSPDETERDREWLVAYLIAHQGYKISDMDRLEAWAQKLSPRKVRTMVQIYRQKHDVALQREAADQQLRAQQLKIWQAEHDRMQAGYDRINQEQTQAAEDEQQRLNTQQKQAHENFMQGLDRSYYGNGGYYGGWGVGTGLPFSPYYHRYWY